MAQFPGTEGRVVLAASGIVAGLSPRFQLGPIDISVLAGEHVSLLGPSGSGKTTLLQLLTGHLAPTAGNISVLGQKRIAADQLLAGFAGMHYVSQDAGMPPLQRVRDTLRRVLAHLPIDKQQARIEHLAYRFDIEPYLSAKAEELSQGQRQRCGLAVAFAPKPMLVALDEPFSHQDAWLRQRMLEAVRQEADEAGATLIVCTHDLDEAYFLTRSALYLLDGKRVYQGNLSGLKKIALPEVQSLFGWVSASDGQWVRLAATSSTDAEAIEVTVEDCLPLLQYHLLKGYTADHKPVWVTSQSSVEKGALVWAIQKNVNAES